MITINEAINQCYRIIHNKTVEAETLKDDYEIFVKDCLDDAEVHKQLAKWLKELKAVHTVIDDMPDYMGVCVGYLKDKMKEA